MLSAVMATAKAAVVPSNALEVREMLKKIQKNLECPICLEMLTDPHNTKCGHLFCKECICTAIARTKVPKCPLCKEPISKRSLSENKRLAEIVEAVAALEQAFIKDTGITNTPPRAIPHNQGETGHTLHHPTPVKPRPQPLDKRQQQLKVGKDKDNMCGKTSSVVSQRKRKLSKRSCDSSTAADTVPPPTPSSSLSPSPSPSSSPMPKRKCKSQISSTKKGKLPLQPTEKALPIPDNSSHTALLKALAEEELGLPDTQSTSLPQTRTGLRHQDRGHSRLRLQQQQLKYQRYDSLPGKKSGQDHNRISDGAHKGVESAATVESNSPSSSKMDGLVLSSSLTGEGCMEDVSLKENCEAPADTSATRDTPEGPQVTITTDHQFPGNKPVFNPPPYPNKSNDTSRDTLLQCEETAKENTLTKSRKQDCDNSANVQVVQETPFFTGNPVADSQPDEGIAGSLVVKVPLLYWVNENTAEGEEERQDFKCPVPSPRTPSSSPPSPARLTLTSSTTDSDRTISLPPSPLPSTPSHTVTRLTTQPPPYHHTPLISTSSSTTPDLQLPSSSTSPSLSPSLFIPQQKSSGGPSSYRLNRCPSLTTDRQTVSSPQHDTSFSPCIPLQNAQQKRGQPTRNITPDFLTSKVEETQLSVVPSSQMSPPASRPEPLMTALMLPSRGPTLLAEPPQCVQTAPQREATPIWDEVQTEVVVIPDSIPHHTQPDHTPLPPNQTSQSGSQQHITEALPPENVGRLEKRDSNPPSWPPSKNVPPSCPPSKHKPPNHHRTRHAVSPTLLKEADRLLKTLREPPLVATDNQTTIDIDCDLPTPKTSKLTKCHSNTHSTHHAKSQSISQTGRNYSLPKQLENQNCKGRRNISSSLREPLSIRNTASDNSHGTKRPITARHVHKPRKKKKTTHVDTGNESLPQKMVHLPNDHPFMSVSTTPFKRE